VEAQEHNPYLCCFINGLVDYVVIGHHLLLGGKGQILHTGILLLEVDVAEATVEQDFARIQLEFQAKLLVVDIIVTAQVEQRVIKVGERLFKVSHEEVGNTLLEVGDGEILVQPHSALVAIDLCRHEHTLTCVRSSCYLPLSRARRG
jgi:hypothetical protein